MIMARMAGKRSPSSWQALSALALGALAVEVGCDTKESNEASAPPEEVQEAIADLLVDVWGKVVEPILTDALSAANAMHTANQAWGTALANGEDGIAEQEAAQQAWHDAMYAWQVAEMVQIGPAGSSLKVTGGLDLRDEIYSWPTTNPCRVDQVTAKFDYESETFFDDALVNVYGFDALETLLFSPANENVCPSQVSINRDGLWADLGADGVAASRAAYAQVISAQIIANITDIDEVWTTSFASDIATSGGVGSSFESYILGVNAIFDALFYLETQTKDRKLGWPLGLTPCGEEDCTDEIETPLAGGSQDWITANLEGFRTLFTGGDGGGMDDLLISVGSQAMVTNVIAALDAADAATLNLSMPLDQGLSEELEAVESAHTEVREVTTILKNDMATVLTLQIPSEAAGDND